MREKKKCHICGKFVYEMGYHIANIHPQILQKLEENNDNEAQTSQEKQQTLPNYNINPPLSQSNRVVLVGQNNINDLIREKLDTMLNIKIIQMLSLNPDVSITDLQKAVNPPPPPQQATLQDIKAYHDIIYKDNDNNNESDSGSAILDIVKEGMPILRDMLSKKQEIKQQGVNQNVRARESTNPGILKPIQLQAPGNTGKPGSVMEKPGVVSDAK